MKRTILITQTIAILLLIAVYIFTFDIYRKKTRSTTDQFTYALALRDMNELHYLINLQKTLKEKSQICSVNKRILEIRRAADYCLGGKYPECKRIAQEIAPSYFMDVYNDVSSNLEKYDICN